MRSLDPQPSLPSAPRVGAFVEETGLDCDTPDSKGGVSDVRVGSRGRDRGPGALKAE